jgi:predicted nucleotidyltransferase
MSESDPPSTTLSLRIKTLAAELPGIDILASATVLELKRRIIEEHIEQPASKRVQLVMLQQTDRANCVLLSDDSQTLKTYNLINGAELSLIIETLPPITEVIPS